MAISRVGGATAEATTITIPAGHTTGDLIVMFAYRDGSNTIGTIPSGWQKLEGSGANTNSAIVACKWATSSAETSGTWTSATNLAVAVYRGAGGAATLTTGTAASTSIAFNALNAMWNNSGTSWVVGFAGHRSINTAITTAPTGMTNVAGANGATAGIAVHDTNAGVSSWSTQTVAAGGTSSGWRSAVVEIFPSGTFGILQRSENKAATATSLSVTPQITPTNGNLLVLIVGFANNVGTPGTPTGFTLIDAGSNASGAGLASYYRVAASESGGAYTVTGNGSSDSWSAALFEIMGQNTTTPINQHSAQHLAASGTTYATPSVTPSAVPTLALLTFTQDLDSATFTINGTTNVVSNVHPGSNHGLGVAMMSAPTADTVTAITQTWTGAASDTFDSAILIGKAAAGTAYTSTLTGGVSFTGSQSKRTSRPLTAAAGFAGTMARAIAHVLTGGLSFTGTTNRRTSRSVTGGASFAGAANRQTSRALTGGSSFTGSFAPSRLFARALTAVLSFTGGQSKQTGRGLSGTLTSGGSLSRRVSRAFSAVLSFAGSLASLKSTGGGTTYTQALSGALSFTGSQVKRTGRNLTGTLTSTGSLGRFISRALSAAVGFVGALISSGGTSTPPGDVDWAFGRPFTDWQTRSPVTEWSVGSPVTGWATGTTVTSWKAQPPTGGWSTGPILTDT